jgi:hypothetical protein
MHFQQLLNSHDLDPSIYDVVSSLNLFIEMKDEVPIHFFIPLRHEQRYKENEYLKYLRLLN